MYCRQCGVPLPEDARFCTKCGFDNAAPMIFEAPPAAESPSEPYAPLYEQSAYPQPVAPYPAQAYQPQQPFVSEEQKQEANSVLIWGILGLAFSCSFFLSFLGIIFSAVAKKKAKAYIARWGTIYGKAKVGNILSTVGIPVGIVFTVLFVIYLIVYISFFAALFSGALNDL